MTHHLPADFPVDVGDGRPATPDAIKAMEKKWCLKHRQPYYGDDGCDRCLLKSILVEIIALRSAKVGVVTIGNTNTQNTPQVPHAEASTTTVPDVPEEAGPES